MSPTLWMWLKGQPKYIRLFTGLSFGQLRLSCEPTSNFNGIWQLLTDRHHVDGFNQHRRTYCLHPMRTSHGIDQERPKTKVFSCPQLD